MANFVGKWKLTNTEGFDDYMKAVGIGVVQRTLGAATKPSQEITVNDDQITIKISSLLNTSELSFKLNEEFDETTGDGRKYKMLKPLSSMLDYKTETTVTLENENKLVQEQVGEPNSTLTREIKDDKTMVMTLKAKDATSIRTYTRE